MSTPAFASVTATTAPIRFPPVMSATFPLVTKRKEPIRPSRRTLSVRPFARRNPFGLHERLSLRKAGPLDGASHAYPAALRRKIHRQKEISNATRSLSGNREPRGAAVLSGARTGADCYLDRSV